MYVRRPTCQFSLVLLLSTLVFSVHGQETRPIHERIDEAIAKSHLGPLAAVANDYDFLRRVYLNLVGRSPTVGEVKAFTDDSEPGKRAKKIEALLNSPEFNEYYAAVLDVMFMERRTGRRIDQKQWRTFLHDAMKKKWPFDQIVQTIIKADGAGDLRGSAKFLIDREVEANALTRDIGRIFLGRDLQCAQCHDHPNIFDYEQSEYYGILAFVNRSYLFEEETDEADKKKAYVGEKAEGETKFSSVFAPDDSSRTIPQLLNELTLEVEPRIEGTEAYVIAPSKEAAGVPKFSRRAQLARLITHPANEHFAKNVVNRYWKHMMGHGLVEPVDFHHSDNPPSHPELLKLLADAFVDTGFNIRELLRQIALSRTYQLSIEFPVDTVIADAEVSDQREQLSEEISELESTLSDLATTEISQRLEARRERLAALDNSITDSAKQLAELKKERDTLAKAQEQLQVDLQQRQSQLTLLEEAITAAKKVADSFSDDKPLAEKYSDYRQRADQLAKKIEAIQSQLSEKKVQVGENAEQTKVTEVSLAQLRAERIGLADMVAEIRGAYREADSRQRQKKTLIAGKEQRLAVLTLYQEYLAKLHARETLQGRSAELAVAVDAKAGERESLAQTREDIQSGLLTQRESISNLTIEFEEVSAALADRQGALDTLSEVIKTARSVAEQLNEPQLDSAIKSIDEKYIELADQLASNRQLATEKGEQLALAQTKLAELETEQAEIETKQTAIAELEEQLAEATAGRDTAIAEENAAYEELRQSWERRFAVRSVVPLSPEQLAGSTISALELKARFQQEAESEWQKKHEDKKPEEIDDATKAKEIAALIKKQVDQVTNTYISIFAAPGGSPQDVFSSTVDQALFYANDGRVQSWFKPSEGSLLKRLETVDNPAELAEELYLAVLSRPATDHEKSEVKTYLLERTDDRETAIRELTWGLVSSLEFRFNR